jgi:hypothetical protein
MTELLGIILVLAALAIFAYFIVKFYLTNLAVKQQNKLAKNWIFYLVEVPREQKPQQGENPKQAKELIAVFEQFLSTLYSVYKKDFKRQISGQPHFSLEITAMDGEIGFYLATPREYADQIEKQIYAFYPSATVTQLKEYRLFKEAPKALSLATVELSKKFVLPLNSYLNFEADPLNGLTNPLTRVAKNDKSIIQLVLRPADEYWTHESNKAAEKLMKGEEIVDTRSKFEKNASKVTGLVGEVWQAANAEDKKQNLETPAQVTPLGEEQVKAVQEKASKPAFEVQMRILATGDDSVAASTNLRILLTSLSQFSSPERNGLKIKEISEDNKKKQILTDIIFRSFDPREKNMLLNTEEISSLYHFPNQFIETPHIKWLLAKQANPPANLPTEGTLLGKSIFRGKELPVYIKEEDRLRHIYMMGKTGTGKSTVIQGMALSDIKAGRGVAVIDPHGDLAEYILARIPSDRVKDVIYFDPGSNLDMPLGFNMLEWHRPEEKDFLIQEAIEIFYKLFDPTRQGFVGPQFEHWFRNAALTLMDQPNGGSLVEIPALFIDDNFKNQCIANIKDPVVKSFWEKQMAQTADFHKSEMLNYFISKFGRFMTNDMIRNIIGQKKSGFDLRQIMDQGKILIVNLSKGKVGEMNSNMLGLILISKLQMAAMSRADTPEEKRRDFFVYVDEFQNFVTDSFASILSEARKYKLGLTIANQYIAQLDEQIRDAVFGNVGTLISFRVGAQEAEYIAHEFEPVFDEFDLVNVAKFNAYVRMIIDNMPARPFSMITVKEDSIENPQILEQIKQMVKKTYGRPQALVEQETTAFVRAMASATPPADMPKEKGEL